MKIIDYEKIKKYTKKDFLKTFGHYKEFLNHLGSPQNSYRTIIITGSAGKGTTAKLVSLLLQKHGFKTGCYTSPHLVDRRERIKFNGVSILSSSYSKYEKYILNKVKQFNGTRAIPYIPTFFELLTLVALLYFKDKHADFTVLEVGLGGRLDACNVSQPALNFILSICKEHTNFLGTTEQMILIEKQEVIKKNSITVTLLKDKSLLKILQKKCAKENSELYGINADFQLKIININENIIEFDYNEHDVLGRYKIPLTSLDAVENYGAVICGLSKLITLRQNILHNLFLKTRVPGRFFIVKHGNARLILDGGHNILSMQSLAKTINKLKWENISIIFTLMADKKADDVLRILSAVSKRIILTKVGIEREYPMDKLFNIARKYFPEILLTKDLSHALELTKGRDTLITGSFFLAGKAMTYLNIK